VRARETESDNHSECVSVCVREKEVKRQKGREGGKKSSIHITTHTHAHAHTHTHTHVHTNTRTRIPKGMSSD